MSSNKIWCSIAALLTIGSPVGSLAGELTVFSDPGLVVLQSGKDLFGYYVAIEGGRSCEFFIVKSPDAKWTSNRDGSSFLKIKTFSLGFGELRFTQRNSEFDTSGQIVRKSDEWTLQTDVEPPGCGSAVGVFAKKDGILPYRFFTEHTLRAIGIRVIAKKTFLYNKAGNSYVKRHGYLTQNDTVALLAEEGEYSSVRYFDPNYFSESIGKVTTGWVHSADLVDPFPPAIKQ